jgi:hypothetical protein
MAEEKKPRTKTIRVDWHIWKRITEEATAANVERGHTVKVAMGVFLALPRRDRMRFLEGA